MNTPTFVSAPLTRFAKSVVGDGVVVGSPGVLLDDRARTIRTNLPLATPEGTPGERGPAVDVESWLPMEANEGAVMRARLLGG
jgi:hypothetical protein